MADEDDVKKAAQNEQSAADQNKRDPLRAPPPDYEPTRAEPAEDPGEGEQIDQLKARGRDINAKLVDAKAEADEAALAYARLSNEAALNNAALLKLVGTPARRPTTIAEFAAQEKRRGRPLVTCMVPKAFQHRLDDHTLVDVMPGVRQIPAALADHWWFRANGVVSQG